MSDALLVPEYVNGMPTFVPFRQDIQRLLREGDPTIGWEGDPALFIAPRPKGGWMVGRMNPDGGQTMICYSKPPHRLDEELLVRMRDMDTRKVNVLERSEKHNAQLRKNIHDKAVDRMSEALDRVVHGLNKDIGYHYG